MKAYVIENTGGPEVLQLSDVPTVPPHVNEVRIRVKAFGLNRAEISRRNGAMGPISGPLILGIEAVGEVIEDPSGLLRVGEAVATAMGGMQFARNGSYAEEVTVSASNVIPLGKSTLTWEELGALPMAYITAWGALNKSLNVASGQTLLVRGATSSVGLASVLYAKTKGLKVIATTRSSNNIDRLREVGADYVVLDKGEIASDIRKLIPEGVDVAVDLVGGGVIKDTLRTLRPFGAVSVVGLLSGVPLLDQFNLMQDLPDAIKLNFFSSRLFGSGALPAKEVPMPEIISQISAGLLPSILVKTFEFEDLRKAHSLMERNQAVGKLVIRV